MMLLCLCLSRMAAMLLEDVIAEDEERGTAQVELATEYLQHIRSEQVCPP